MDSSRTKNLKLSAWYLLLQTIFIALISLNYFRQLSIDFSGEAWIYTGTTMFGHFAMLSGIAWGILCLPATLLFPKHKLTLPALTITAGTLGSILILADTFVFGLYRYHIYNSFVIDLLVGDNAGGIFTFSFSQITLILIAVFALISISIGFWFLAKKILLPLKSKILYITLGGLLLMLASSHLMHAFYSANGSRSVYRIAEVYPAYFPLTANRFLIRQGWVDPEKVRGKIKLNSETALNYPRNPLQCSTPPNKNILIIFIDSWNARVFAPEIMPNTCKFAKNAQVFTQHYSGDHGTRTGVLSFFHGIPGLYFNSIRDGNVSSVLVDLAIAHHYEMAIYATASLANPPFTRTAFKNVPENALRYNLSNGGTTADGDINLTKTWLNFTQNYTQTPAEKRKPFFGFLFFDELHSMNFPKDAEKKFPSEWEIPHYELLGKNLNPEPFFNLYKNDAFWLDKLLKKIFDDLKERNLLENTIVIITGDHGQEFNEDGNNIWGHGSVFSNAQLHVPFILFDSKLSPKTYTHWTSHYDANVTLLKNYFSVNNPENDFSVGKNLFDTSPREWLLVGHPEQFGVIEKDRITHVKFDRSYEIYDRNYQELPDAKLNSKIFQKALEQAKSFYK